MANEAAHEAASYEETGRDLGRRLSTAVVLFHQAIAERFGINATDLKCAELLSRRGPMTAGQLAVWTGLGTGTITTVIDRMERAGLARRERDPQDRRKVIIQPLADRQDEIGQLYTGLSRPMGELMAHYDAHQIQAILEFVTGTIAILEEQTIQLRAAK